MSSISGFSGSMSTLIDQVGTNQYRVVNRQDKDGDGVTDGKALSGDDGKVVNEGTLNQMLKARGLAVSNGEFRSVDGFTLTSSNTSVVTLFGSDPVLPNVSGASASATSMRGQMDWYSTTKGLDDAALMWMALSTLATTSMRDMKDANQIKRAMQKGKLEAKTNEISASESRIAAERAAASQAFTFAVVGAVASATLGALAQGGATSGATSGAVQGLSGTIGNVVNAFGTMLSKNSGPQAEADRQQIREKEFAKQQEVMDMAVEEAKSNYDESKELFKQALKAISDHVDREVQVTQAITRG